MKIWIYNNASIPKMAWEFTIYSFPIIFLENLVATKHLNRWARVSRWIDYQHILVPKNK